MLHYEQAVGSYNHDNRPACSDSCLYTARNVVYKSHVLSAQACQIYFDLSFKNNFKTIQD